MNLRDFQLWLNVKGAGLVVDGKRGPATRAAILDTFINKAAPAITQGELATFASQIGCTPKQLAAVAKVESAGGGWDDAGRLKCLFERHYAWRRLRVLIPILSNPTPGGYTMDADRDGINDSWEKVADLSLRGSPLVAFESASWGMFQVMGAHAKSLGYPNAIEMVWQLTRSEAAHYRLLTAFIQHNGLTGAVRRLSTNPADNVAFARSYNGKGFAKGAYHEKLARAMK